MLGLPSPLEALQVLAAVAGTWLFVVICFVI